MNLKIAQAKARICRRYFEGEADGYRFLTDILDQELSSLEPGYGCPVCGGLEQRYSDIITDLATGEMYEGPAVECCGCGTVVPLKAWEERSGVEPDVFTVAYMRQLEGETNRQATEARLARMELARVTSAIAAGWTEIHGGSPAGAFWRGKPPGWVEGQPMEEIPQ